MEKLFDETNEYNSNYYRTIWYGYIDISGNLNKELVNTLVSIIKNDLAENVDKSLAASHWVFYTKDVSEDAIEEKVRPSIMIRESQGVFVSNDYMSDFDFVTAFDKINKFRIDLENQLQIFN